MTFKRQQERTCEARTVQKVTLILPIKAKENLTFMQKTGRLAPRAFLEESSSDLVSDPTKGINYICTCRAETKPRLKERLRCIMTYIPRQGDEKSQKLGAKKKMINRLWLCLLTGIKGIWFQSRCLERGRAEGRKKKLLLSFNISHRREPIEHYKVVEEEFL